MSALPHLLETSEAMHCRRNALCKVVSANLLRKQSNNQRDGTFIARVAAMRRLTGGAFKQYWGMCREQEALIQPRMKMHPIIPKFGGSGKRF